MLQLIRQLPGPAFCPEEVYQEVVDTGLNRGYADAFLISKEIFSPDLPLVKIVAVSNRLRTQGISPVDDCVLSLAFQKNAILMTEDIRLREKAYDSGVKTNNSPEFLIYYLDYDAFKSTLDKLVLYKRLDAKALNTYLEVKKQWKSE